MRAIPKQCDVLVIGGGPAGSCAAGLLAKRGIDVVLLEKETFPRQQVGESLIPHFWKYLDALEVSEEVLDANFIVKRGGAVYWNDVLRGVSFSDFGHKRPGLHVERDEFDNILLKKAGYWGAQIFQNTAVRSVDLQDDRCIIQYTDQQEDSQGQIVSKFLIDASGQSAVVSKQYGFRKFDPDFKFQAFWGYFDKSKYLNGEGELTDFEHRSTDPPRTLVSSPGGWGWVWNIVMKEKVSVGAIIPRDEIARFKEGGEDLESRFLNHVMEVPMMGGVLSDANLVGEVKTIRDYAYLPHKLVHKNCYLAGDAAAFVDPISSEGITVALYAAYFAAWAIGNSLEQGKRKEFYQNVYVRNLEMRLNLFKLLAWPGESISDNLDFDITHILENQSLQDNYLTLAQLILTGRGKNFHEVLKSCGINEREVIKQLEVPVSLLQG